jgi:hypothetical protein
MRACRWLLVLASVWLGAPTVAAIACEVPRNFNVRGRIQSGDVIVLFRTVPTAIEIGQQFSVEAVVCVNPPSPRATGFRVDAQMPEHSHGMNYRPQVTAKGDGFYVAEGLLFHMPGNWQLVFDVEQGDRTERLAIDVILE